VALRNEIVTRAEAQRYMVIKHGNCVDRVHQRSVGEFREWQVDPTTQVLLEVFECGPSDRKLANRELYVPRLRTLPPVARPDR
jgi:hypothetical protein